MYTIAGLMSQTLRCLGPDNGHSFALRDYYHSNSPLMLYSLWHPISSPLHEQIFLTWKLYQSETA